MKRDDLLVLNILSSIEQDPDVYVDANGLLTVLTSDVVGLDREPWTVKQVLGHLLLLEDMHLIQVEKSEDADSTPPLPRYGISEKYAIFGIRLTWHGHEYLAEHLNS